MSNPSFPLESQLSEADLELLARARQQREQVSVPAEVRERICRRVVAEVGSSHPALGAAATPMLPVRHGVGRGLGLTCGLVVGILALANARDLFDSAPGTPPAAAEPESAAVAGSARAARARWLDAPVFRASARVLGPSEALPAAPNLFAEAPFAAPGGAWQVRRWNDPSADPVEPAAHDFAEGALCVRVGAGERVLGAWPWVAAGSAPPERVPLEQGKRYRLSFKAWAREPLPHLLIGLGHSRLPFSGAAGARVPVSTEARPFVVDFESERDDPSIGVAFLAVSSADSGPTRVCLSDVRLSAR